jgi:hypothetical protein
MERAMKKPKRTFKQNRIFTQNNPLSPRICPELASEIGLDKSILLLQYEFWIATEGEERNGHLWIRKTVREIKQVFSFWSTSTINRIINKLTDDGYVVADALDEDDKKNGRWLRFGFDRLGTLKSIKIISAETGECLSHSGTNVCATLNNDLSHSETNTTQDGTNNGSSPYGEERDQENKEPSPHSRLMDFQQLRTGPIANGARDGKAAKWLLDHGYDPQQCMDCFDALMAQEWRTAAVSWWTVQTNIGSWMIRTGNENGNGRKPTASEKRVDQLRSNMEFLRSNGRSVNR